MMKKSAVLLLIAAVLVPAVSFGCWCCASAGVAGLGSSQPASAVIRSVMNCCPAVQALTDHRIFEQARQGSSALFQKIVPNFSVLKIRQVEPSPDPAALSLFESPPPDIFPPLYLSFQVLRL